jgi:hypothetical protein
MSDILISNNTSKYSSIIYSLEKTGEVLQEIVTTYNFLGLLPLNSEDFFNLISNPAELVFDKMSNGEDISIGGLKVDKQKAIEIILKPKGYNELLAKIEEIFKRISESEYWISYKNIPVTKQNVQKFYVINNGSISINSTCNLEIKELCKLYAKSDASKQAYSLATSLISVFNEHDTKNLIRDLGKRSIGEFINELFGIDSSHNANSKATFEINPDNIDSYNRNNYYKKS